MSIEFELRPYQLEAVEAVETAWRHGVNRPVIVLPTGTGKTVVIAELLRLYQDLHPLVITPRDLLCKQVCNSLYRLDPTIPPVGLVTGGRKETNSLIVAATFQSLFNPRTREQLGVRDLVIVDEMHHSVAEKYKEVLEFFGVHQDGYTRAVGFTATAVREDKLVLKDVWDTVVYEKTIDWAVEQKYLVPPKAEIAVIPNLHLNKITVDKKTGDYKLNDLSKEFKAVLPEIVEAIVTKTGERKKIIFTTDIQNGQTLAHLLNQQGMRISTVFGSDTDKQRAQVYQSFTESDLEGIVTVQVLTEGADFPICDCVVIAAPTKSATKYTQMIGRGLRPYMHPNGEVKEDCLILDLAGATADSGGVVTLSDIFNDREENPFTFFINHLHRNKINEDTPQYCIDIIKYQLTLGVSKSLLKDIMITPGSSTVWVKTSHGLFTPISKISGEGCTPVGYLFAQNLKQNAWNLYTIPLRKYGGTITPAVSDGKPVELPLNLLLSSIETMLREESLSCMHYGKWMGNTPSIAQKDYINKLGVTPTENSKGSYAVTISREIFLKDYAYSTQHYHL